ncbi:hypothetical protein [uncultured Maribacter sp.]|uniref:hypothetical protein n=1 Tax=uncultured Maribacter sp. TaxID=431308 RepID=UPI00260FB6A4|nr:hypothetical protein [uncultured Maribacter sp.]
MKIAICAKFIVINSNNMPERLLYYISAIIRKATTINMENRVTIAVLEFIFSQRTPKRKKAVIGGLI